MTSIKIPEDIKQKLKDTLAKCDEQVDYQGWRYSYNVGLEPYDEIDVDEVENQRAFWYSHLFLKSNFGRKMNVETVNSYDLKHAFETWWSAEFPNKPKVYVSNGLMLLAIVYTNLCPNELWYSMDLTQYACISKTKWKTFCEKYDFRPRNDLVD